MFINTEILNEGRTASVKAKGIKQAHSEGKNPKSLIVETKLSSVESIKSFSCVNSNWQKLRK